MRVSLVRDALGAQGLRRTRRFSGNGRAWSARSTGAEPRWARPRATPAQRVYARRVAGVTAAVGADAQRNAQQAGREPAAPRSVLPLRKARWLAQSMARTRAARNITAFFRRRLRRAQAATTIGNWYVLGTIRRRLRDRLRHRRRTQTLGWLTARLGDLAVRRLARAEAIDVSVERARKRKSPCKAAWLRPLASPPRALLARASSPAPSPARGQAPSRRHESAIVVSHDSVEQAAARKFPHLYSLDQLQALHVDFHWQATTTRASLAHTPPPTPEQAPPRRRRRSRRRSSHRTGLDQFASSSSGGDSGP